MTHVYVIPDDLHSMKDVSAICSSSLCTSIESGTMKVELNWTKSDNIYDRMNCSGACAKDFNPSIDQGRMVTLMNEVNHNADMMSLAWNGSSLSVTNYQHIPVIKVSTGRYYVHRGQFCDADSTKQRKVSEDCGKDCDSDQSCVGYVSAFDNQGHFCSKLNSPYATSTCVKDDYAITYEKK